MAPPKVPAGWELEGQSLASAKTPPKPPEGWELEPPAGPAQGAVGVAGSPLERALTEQSGDVVTVETPTGPAKFTRSGDRFYDAEESQQMLDAGGARLKERALATAANMLGNGGLGGPQQAGLLAVTRPWIKSTAARPDEGVIEHYRRIRDATKRDLGEASRTSNVKPEIMGHKVDVLPLLASAAPSIFAPNPAGFLGRIALSGAVGAEQAANASEADLTRGEVLPLLKDTGRGLGYGLATGGVAEGVTAPIKFIARGAASRIGDSVATQAAKDAKAVADEIASTRGQLGAESQKASRMFENTQRAAGGGVAVAGDSPINPVLQGKALLALSDPSTVRLQEKVLNRTLGEMPSQTAVVERLEQELAQKTANASAEAAKRTQDYFAKPVFGSEVAPRLGRIAKGLAVGSTGGAVLGGAEGLYTGDFSKLPDRVMMGAIGGVAGGSGLKTMVKNFAANPRAQVGALEALIQASQAGQQAMRTGARSAAPAAAAPRLEAEEEAIQAFLGSP